MMNFNNPTNGRCSMIQPVYLVNFMFDDSMVLSNTICEMSNNIARFFIHYDMSNGYVAPLEKILKMINKKIKGDVLITYKTPTGDDIYSLLIKNFHFVKILNPINVNLTIVNDTTYNKYTLDVSYDYDKIIFLKNNKTETRINKLNIILDNEDENTWYEIPK